MYSKGLKQNPYPSYCYTFTSFLTPELYFVKIQIINFLLVEESQYNSSEAALQRSNYNIKVFGFFTQAKFLPSCSR